MPEKCVRCGVRGDLVKLYDAIYDGEMNLLCERCSIIENVPVIQKPTSVQLKSAERRGISVEERLKDMAGLTPGQKKEVFSPQERLRELNSHPELEVPDERRLDLIDHFGWEIMKHRRRKGLSQRQLAEMLGESEAAIDMLEKGKIPRDSEALISKLEQFFQFNIRKLTYFDKINEKETKRKPVLIDGYGRPVERLPEPEPVFVKCEVEVKHDKKTPLIDGMEVTECKVEKPSKGFFNFLKRKSNEAQEEVKVPEVEKPAIKNQEPAVIINNNRPTSRYLQFREREKQRALEKSKETFKPRPEIKNEVKIEEKEEEFKLPPDEDLDITKIDVSKVKIADLKRAHNTRIETSKSERTEEQRKIEERQKMIEARKEEMRLKKEQESKDIDKYLGGSELLK